MLAIRMCTRIFTYIHVCIPLETRTPNVWDPSYDTYPDVCLQYDIQHRSWILLRFWVLTLGRSIHGFGRLFNINPWHKYGHCTSAATTSVLRISCLSVWCPYLVCDIVGGYHPTSQTAACWPAKRPAQAWTSNLRLLSITIWSYGCGMDVQGLRNEGTMLREWPGF